ncbi:MAG: glycosyltransferase family 4 protein, partial [Gammaproteobacteria bacterium]
MNQRICFVLPVPHRAPVGGFKVVYEHANRLARRGYTVTVVHPALDRCDAPPLRRVKSYLRYLQKRVDRSYRPEPYFQLDPRVRVVWTPSLEEHGIADGDHVVATGWQTAEWIRNYGPRKGQRIYLVQEYERYMAANEADRRRIAQTYSMAARYVAISPAVQQILRRHGVTDVAYVPNGIDFNAFHLETPIRDPARHYVGFPTRPEPYKGTADGIESLAAVRRELGESLKVWSFGGKRPPTLPDWVEYHERPSDDSLRGLYNRTAVFVVPSYYEGWGLPGAEAMACGAALVTTDNGGARAYAEPERTA